MIADEIRAVLAAKADALLRRSADDMAALLHPGFVYVNAGGYRLNKALYIENGCTSGRLVFRSQKVSDLEVSQTGDIAVATMVLDDQFSLEGREITATFKSLCVYTRQDGQWLWLAGQTMRPSRA
jgi:hypothetical protein